MYLFVTGLKFDSLSSNSVQRRTENHFESSLYFLKMVFKNEKYQRRDCLLDVFVCRMSSMVAGKTKVKHSFHIK